MVQENAFGLFLMISRERLILIAHPLVVKFTERRWSSQFGLSLERVRTVQFLTSAPPRGLLWLMWYLKTYPTESQAASTLGVSERTFRTRVRRSLAVLLELLPEVRGTSLMNVGLLRSDEFLHEMGGLGLNLSFMRC